MEDVKIKTTPQIATLRSGAFQKVEDPTEGEVVAKEVKVADDVIKAKITESVKEIAETINLEEAEVIVSGGRGMGSKENFALVDDLAKLLGGVVGAQDQPLKTDGYQRFIRLDSLERSLHQNYTLHAESLELHSTYQES